MPDSPLLHGSPSGSALDNIATCGPAHSILEVCNVAELWPSAEKIAAHLGIMKDIVFGGIFEKAARPRADRLWKFPGY